MQNLLNSEVKVAEYVCKVNEKVYAGNYTERL